MRIINNSAYNFHTESLFKSCQILPVTDQYKFNVQKFMYQHKHGILPRSFSNLDYFASSDKPQTRQYNLANCTRCRTKFTSLLPLHMFPKIWNELGSCYQEKISLGKFKSAVRVHYLSTYRSSVRCQNTRCRQCFAD